MDGENQIETITFFTDVDGDIYPEKELPENARKLKGFIWRGDERIKTKEDIFPEDEVELDKKIVEESRERYEKGKLSQEIEKNKLEDHINGDDFYEEIFRKFNNCIIKDGKGVFYLVKNCKFRLPTDGNSVGKYIKKYPGFNKIVEIKNFNWNPNTEFGKKYNAGYFKGDEDLGVLEFAKNNKYSNEELFERYNFRQVIDKSGYEMLIRNKKVYFPKDDTSWNKLYKKYPKYKKLVRINQYIWDWNNQNLLNKYNGGFFTGDEGE